MTKSGISCGQQSSA